MSEAIFTQFAALLAAALLIPSLVFLAYGVNHRDMPFWWTAAGAYMLVFSGSIIAAFRGASPEIVVTLFGNVLIGLGYFFSVRSIRQAKSYWKFNRFDCVITSIYILALISVLSLANTYNARVAVVSAHIALLSVSALLIIYGSSERISRLGDAMLFIFAVGYTVVASLRCITAMIGQEAVFLSFQFWDQAFFVWSIAAVFCFALGLFLNGTAMITYNTLQALSKERALTEALSDALESKRNLKKLILHELKRPLNGITIALDVARANKRGMSHAGVLRVHQLANVANDYLRSIGEYEHIDAIFEDLILSDVEVENLCNDIRSKWRVPVKLQSKAKLHTLSVEAVLFDVAIGNLLENALKFGSDAAAVQVIVRAESDHILFDVIDDGHGIPPDESERVFQQFYKLEGQQKNPLKGCGLGLHVAQRIAKAHNGTVQVFSQTPSTLRLSLPVNRSSGDANE